MRKFIRAQLDRYFGRFATRSDIDNLYVQLSSLLQIQELTGSGVRLGHLRGWAISPDALITVLSDICERSAPRVLEFGAGESTIAIAATLRRLGAGSLTTIEHDAGFRKSIVDRLSRAGLDTVVDMRAVGIRDYGPRSGFAGFRSYDLESLDVDYDVALVDGPITSAFGAGARLVPLEWCAARLAGSGVIYLDDVARREERSVVDAVKRAAPSLDVQLLPAEKGLARFRRAIG